MKVIQQKIEYATLETYFIIKLLAQLLISLYLTPESRTHSRRPVDRTDLISAGQGGHFVVGQLVADYRSDDGMQTHVVDRIGQVRPLVKLFFAVGQYISDASEYLVAIGHRVLREVHRRWYAGRGVVKGSSRSITCYHDWDVV